MHASSVHTCDPRRNQLLASLPDTEWDRWHSLLERVDMPAGRLLYRSGAEPSHMYFPVTGIVSLLHTMHNGDSTEIAMVGHEGMVGISLLMGGSFMPGDAVVQSAGEGFRLSASTVRHEFQRGSPVLPVLLRYTQTLIEHVAQTAACNRHHSLDQQVCRRLLLGLDRSASAELLMTQESMAALLGVRREGVTFAAVRLQQDGVIRYRRGRIEVLDRDELEHRACECYALTRKTLRQRLGAHAHA